MKRSNSIGIRFRQTDQTGTMKPNSSAKRSPPGATKESAGRAPPVRIRTRTGDPRSDQSRVVRKNNQDLLEAIKEECNRDQDRAREIAQWLIYSAEPWMKLSWKAAVVILGLTLFLIQTGLRGIRSLGYALIRLATRGEEFLMAKESRHTRSSGPVPDIPLPPSDYTRRLRSQQPSPVLQPPQPDQDPVASPPPQGPSLGIQLPVPEPSIIVLSSDEDSSRKSPHRT